MLNRKNYFVREHKRFLTFTSNTYDILDLETQEKIGFAKEKRGKLNCLIHFILSFLIEEQFLGFLPTRIAVYEGDNLEDESKLLFSIQRCIRIFRFKFNICNSDGTVVGRLECKGLTFPPSFYAFDATNNEVALIKGNWKAGRFRVLDNSGNEIGEITKKWAGIGKELFTSSNNYAIALSHEPDPDESVLLLAAGLVADILYHN